MQSKDKTNGLGDYLTEIKKFMPIDEQFLDLNYPLGEICEYRQNKDDRTAINRFTNDEKKALDNSYTEIYKDFRRGAESHRQTRKWVKSWVKPGMKLIDIW